MRFGELHVRVGGRQKGGECPCLVRIAALNDVPLEYDFAVRIPEVSGGDPVMPPDVPLALGGHILESVEKTRTAGEVPATYAPYRLLLEIEPIDLVGLDWEKVLRLSPPGPQVVVTRFVPVSDMRAVRSFELPLSVLHVLPPVDSSPKPADGVTQHFQYVRASGVRDLVSMVRQNRSDIVHVAANAVWMSDKEAALRVDAATGSDAMLVGAAPLSAALSASGARLLILQCLNAASVPMLNFAHRLLSRGGPTTLVVAGATSGDVDQLYMDIVHDDFSYLPFLYRSPSARFVLFHSVGGDRVLRLRPMAERLSKEMRLTSTTGAALLEVAQAGIKPRPIRFGGAPGPKAPAAADSLVSEFKGSLAEYDKASKRVYDYSRESGAWIPMAADRRTQSAMAGKVEDFQRRVDRVVNVGFVDGEDDRRLSSRDMLRPGRRYVFTVQIGRRTDWSVIDGNAAFPENALERQYSADGVQLRVVLFGAGFEIREPDRPLRLERPPAESEELRFDVHAPSKPGLHRVRVCIYKDLNLLQSILVRVRVGERVDSVRRANNINAEVEYALSSTLANVNAFQKRVVNLLANESDDGTHTLAIVGGSLKTTFDFGDGEMKTSVGAARDELLKIAADGKSDPPKYRFDGVTNATTLARLESDIVPLAELGYQLYSNIVTGKDPAFAKELRKALAGAGATIQVAAVKSARYVFPWALVYDQNIVSGTLKLCPQFKSDAAKAAGEWLNAQVCLTSGCPNQGKTDIVCPSGFWGFKHFIEQPLSVSTKPSATGKRDLILEIDGGPAAGAISGLMIISRELKQAFDHEKELRGPNTFAFLAKDTKMEAAECLKDPQLSAHVIYFYCHGGREKARTWLGIGKGVTERLTPSDLTALEIDWTASHPLVFINGCHTADFTTDDLLNFNQVLGYCRAAGVVGTEIAVPESLARFFAAGFLSQFRKGLTVGVSLRQQRLRLLERFNVLGLAYTPYCSADLKVVQH